MGLLKNSIEFVNQAQLLSVIDKRQPQGRFISVDLLGNCTAVENSTGEARAERFPGFSDAITFLSGAEGNNDIDKHLMAIMDLPVGSQYDDYKIWMSTYYIYRKSDNEYSIDRTTSGWVTAVARREMLFRILTHQASLDDLHFV
ncbi:hypothetical protein [Parapedobacter sp. 10938]|uniref:hypothetical protein n=1 Tax=Parapedobacter flavus TaxID=3110225 RepID=UPI002DBC7725|nr:hypothetical protein [Parapedobacter sp. 10938]MEC3881981.1 hypothetical protein [Parapedobacter sp. 10938]